MFFTAPEAALPENSRPIRRDANESTERRTAAGRTQSGTTHINGGSLVFYETIHDKFGDDPWPGLVPNCNYPIPQSVWNEGMMQHETIIHELGHAMTGSEHSPNGNQPIDDITRVKQGEPFRYTEYYWDLIRKAEKPNGP